MELQLAYHMYLRQYRTKYAALYQAMKEAIVSGRIPFGGKLPSSRELAAAYRLSRGTVNQVYDMLAAEGYVSAEVGSGTFAAYRGGASGEAAAGEAAIRLSAWGERVDRLPLRAREPERQLRVRFALGLPDVAAFPRGEWNRCMYAAARELQDASRAEAYAAQGHLPLREAIAAYLRRARGMDVAAERVVITSGSMQAIALLAQLLVDAGDGVVVESPGYAGIRSAVEAAGGIVVPAEVDRHGAVVADWPARLAFVTPSRQFPTGAVLPLERRQALLAWAKRRGAIVVEDDYDSEFRHRGRPIEPLHVLDGGASVVYVGTFSKTMPPDLRLGYAVLPPGLAAPFVKAKRLFEPHPTALTEQRALAAFMNGGQYERHLRRMKRIYGRRFALLFDLLRDRLGEWFAVVPSDAGLHLFAWWRGTRERYEAFRAACRAGGVDWTDSGESVASGDGTPCACFGFAHLEEQDIRDGIAVIENVGRGGAF